MTKAWREKLAIMELAMEAEEAGDTATLLQMVASLAEEVPDDKWADVKLDLAAHDVEV